MNINITDSQLENNAIVIGNNNSVNMNSVNNIDWEMLQDEFIKVLGKLSKKSKEYDASKNALNCAMKEDKYGFIDVLKKNSKIFLSDIFKGVASGTLIEIIKYMMK